MMRGVEKRKVKKHPTDVNQRAKLIVSIGVGDVEDTSGKNESAIALGRLGGFYQEQNV